MFNRAIIPVLFAIMLFGGAGSMVANVHAQSFLTVPLPNVSVTNQVIDFYAGGTSGGYSLRASPQGASLSIDGLGE